MGTDEVECAAETSRDNDPLACGDGCNACNVAIGEICLDGECRCAPGQAEIDGTCGEIQPGTVLTGDPSAGPGGTVRFSGEVTSLGNPVPWQHGVCLGPDAMNLDDCADLGVRDTLGVFTTSGMAVTPGTPFVYAAYIQNGDIRVWGEPRNFLWPTISTQSPTVTGAFSATLRGVVNDLGSPAATARGFCYGTASGPEPGNTPGGGCATSGGAITSGVPYTSDVAGLSEGTPYYVRAWVESIGGRIYGDERSFVTFTRSTVVMPPAAGVAVDQIGTTSARFNAAVATIGNPLSTVPGFCYAVHPATPELGPECVSLPARTTPGNFSSTVSGLVPGTRYNVRAFVTNGAGTNWSAIHDFTALQLPEVSLANVQPALGSVSANVVVNVLGVPSPTEHGLCVATSEAGLASACNSRGPAGSATSFGPYGEPTPSGGTTYYIQAYATNAAGTAYSAVQSFTAWQLPSVATFAETDVQPSSFRAHGRVLGTGVPGTITARGFCVGTSNTPRPGNTPGAGGGCPTNSVSVSGSDFNRVMSGLAPYTTYYVAAFAENAAGRGYGSDVMVTTAPQLPVVATLSPTSVGFEGATLRGRVTTLGNPDPVDARFRWRIQGSGTSNILNFSGGGPSGTNIFSQALGGLAWDTTYEYRSEVYHEAYGWVAGSYVSFTTQDFPAVLVRPTGTNNSNCGRNPSATPCQTVAYAYNTQAANLGRNEVWLIGNSSTTFNETERIDLVAGRHLRGGYSISGGEVTGGGSAPRILSTHWNAVRAVNLASITHIQNVRIQTTNRGNASSAGSAGPSTFVLIVSGGSNRVRLTDVRLIAGRGGNGAAGNTPTQSGCSGANGSAGNSGDDSGTGGNGANGSSGSGCTTASGTFSGGRGGGGSNGNNSGNTGFCGGRPAGGSATCTGGNGGSGGSGRRACSGQAGSGSVGGAGAAGSSGASGGGGAGVGTVNTDNLNAPYSAAGGVAGQPGVSGRGGGGGGGGGGRRCLTTNRRGGGGGGGGNGGYGGLGGGGGGGGGASVAALVINATLHTEAGGNVFQTVGGGSGGSGGSASAGGSGGAGGNGGNGELSSWPFGNEVGGTGGRGGNGGSGGNGGCGGGGGGGPSIGVWHVGSGSGVSGSGRSFQIGGGGSGGNRGTGNCSGNPSSNNGSPGLQAEVY